MTLVVAVGDRGAVPDRRLGRDGRTVGKSFMGLRVVTNSGQPLRPRRAFFRALICATLGAIALAWVIVSRRRAGIHDVIVQTTRRLRLDTTP